MAEGRVIPFLGAGVNFFSRPSGADWGARKSLPSGNELSRLLAETFDYPSPNPHDVADITRVTQYVSAVAGRGALYHELQKLFDADYPISTLHDFLARLPGMLRQKGYSPRGQIILTTNYDDVLERAFDRVNEPFDLLSYSSEEQRSGMFIHHPPHGQPRVIENPND